jgi:hypothetical protein
MQFVLAGQGALSAHEISHDLNSGPLGPAMPKYFVQVCPVAQVSFSPHLSPRPVVLGEPVSEPEPEPVSLPVGGGVGAVGVGAGDEHPKTKVQARRARVMGGPYTSRCIAWVDVRRSRAC